MSAKIGAPTYADSLSMDYDWEPVQKLEWRVECALCHKIIVEAEEPRKILCFIDGAGPFHEKCARHILAEVKKQEESHPCAAIGCTNTVPFADEPRCYTHTRW